MVVGRGGGEGDGGGAFVQAPLQPCHLSRLLGGRLRHLKGFKSILTARLDWHVRNLASESRFFAKLLAEESDLLPKAAHFPSQLGGGAGNHTPFFTWRVLLCGNRSAAVLEA